jgi:hypothetical protein
MAARRLPRGTRLDAVTLFYEVEREHKERWATIADHVGLSPSALFDVMVANIQLDERGYPIWMPEKPQRDGELPIDTA